ncbi:hypothetical protein CGZ95_13445 [Enemella evansiae]|uniref:M60 family metallopeptidase n=1 Tax=Enemella evansiae TaxID=2016499 RepID=UPI000B95ED61|nr:M60 family metallopeptidase [Enemella evansiae]OYN98197.1 hypothetical protein CGZ95_13445 [Enemella evansiae]
MSTSNPCNEPHPSDRAGLSRRTLLGGAAALGAAGALGLGGALAGTRPAAAVTQQRTQLTTACIAARPTEQDRTFQSLTASDLRSTGYYLPPNTELKVSVAAATAEQCELVVGAPDTHPDPSKRAPRSYPLRTGSQKITDPIGGVLYWKVIGPRGYLRATLGETAQPMPYYVYGETNELEFQRQLDTRPTPFVELVSAHAMLTVHRESMTQYRGEDHNELMSLYEEIIGIEDAVAGMDGTTPTHARLAHKYHFITFPGGITGVGAYATHGHMSFPTPIQDRLLTVEGVRMRGWGLYHELGHQHQQTVYKPSSLTEVTVNIYALAVNAAFAVKYGQLPRLHSPQADGQSEWERAFPKIGSPGVDFFTTFTAFEKVVMFEQLRLAFGDDFQPKVHKLIRDERPDPGAYDDEAYRLGQLVFYYSKAAGANLLQFFDRWGMPMTADTRNRVTALGLPQPSVDPSTIRDEQGARLTSRILASPQLRTANGLR